MPEPYIGEIRMFAFGFVPPGWAACDGTVLQIESNVNLFSLIGNEYGGDGETTFALPDLRSRVMTADGKVINLCIALQGVYPPRES